MYRIKIVYISGGVPASANQITGLSLKGEGRHFCDGQTCARIGYIRYTIIRYILFCRKWMQEFLLQRNQN